jgi:CubicO group peptidase (beta-lactamase class C family)
MLWTRMLKLRTTLAYCTVLAGVSGSGQDPSLPTKIDRYLSPYVQGRNFLGAVLVAQGDKVLVNRAYGNASYALDVPNCADTRFHIASISKPFTAAAILLLEQRGRLALDDRVSKYVPDLSHGDEITLRHLLTHTSGIPNVNDLPEYEAASRLHQTPLTLVNLFKSKPLNFAPGSKYEYSNSNYNLLAYVIEKVSGEPYGEFLRENIFALLGLKDTGNDGNSADIIPNSASGYQPKGAVELENASYLDWSSKTGNGSLYSTTSDLFRFLRAYKAGKLIKKSTVDQVWTEQKGNNFGWFVRRSNGELAIASNGRSPGFTSSLEYFPSRDLTVIVLSNSYSPVSQSPIAEDIAAIALGKTVEAPQRIVPISIAADELRKADGRYRFGPDFYRPDAEVQLHSETSTPILDWGNNFRTALIPVAAGEFIDRQFWARIRMDADGSGFTYSTSGRDFKVRRLPDVR